LVAGVVVVGLALALGFANRDAGQAAPTATAVAAVAVLPATEVATRQPTAGALQAPASRPADTATPAATRGEVTGEGGRLRSIPSTGNTGVIAELTPGTTVTIVGLGAGPGVGGNTTWYLVDVDGARGWIWAGNVRLVGAASPPDSAPAAPRGTQTLPSPTT